MTQNGFSPQCIAMLEQRQVHSHTRTKTKKAKTCIKVTKPCSSEENDKKLDGVGPVDNRPTTIRLHHFVQKKKKKKSDMWHMTCDTWHVTCDTWHVTRDTWHMTCDMLWGVNILSKVQLPCSYGLWFLEDWEEKDDQLNQWINEWITRLFIEQPRLHRVC